MPHQLCVLVKHEYEATEDRPSDLRESCHGVIPSSEDVNSVAEGSLFNSMALRSGRQAGEDNESLTEMMTERTTTELYHPNHSTHQRNVSLIKSNSEQQTDQLKQFWKLRYEVQQVQSPFVEKAQEMISFRLTALHRLAMFNVGAIRETKIRQVLKQLLVPGCTPKHDKRRLRKRSQHC